MRDDREKEGLDLGAETSDYDEDWWGVERRGQNNDGRDTEDDEMTHQVVK